MKKNLLFVASVLSAVFLFSCKKESQTINPSPAGPPPANSKVKTVEYGGSISDYLYNADGSINQIISGGKKWYEYQYSPGKVVSLQYLADGSLGEKINMTLNADGLVTDYLNENYPTTLIKYEYNADKSLKAKKNYSNNVLSTITLYTFKDGNLVKDSTFSAGGAPNYSRTYEYYTDRISTIENSHKGMSFWLGYQSKNVLKKEIDFNDGTGAVTGIRNYQQPKLDAVNRVKKTSYQNNGAGAVTTVAYTYY